MDNNDITYNQKLTELRLDLGHPNSANICFVLLEGDTDIRLFRKLFGSKNCKVESIPGGNFKLETAVSALVEDTFELVMGIRDADFLRLGTLPYSKKNMFLTDYHDIEMLLVANDETISAIFYEYTDIPHINHNSIREKIISTIQQISLLKWLNYRENLELQFEAGFQDLISFDTCTIDFDQYFSRVLSKSPNAKIKDIATINAKIDALKASNEDPYQLCNGHDFVKAMAQFIREQGKVASIKNDMVSSILRMTYTKEKFYSTQLYISTKTWADSKNLDIYN